MPVVVKEDNFQREVMESSLPVILDIYATWCGPCLQMAPIFEELEKEYGNAYRFAKLNVDDDRNLSIKLGVTSIPTFIFVKEGQIKHKITGYIAKSDLKQKIEDYLK